MCLASRLVNRLKARTKGMSVIAYCIKNDMASRIDRAGRKTTPSINGARLLIIVANGLMTYPIIKIDAMLEDGSIRMR